MIKINLLGVAPPASRIPSVGGAAAPRTTLVMIFVGAMIVAFGIVGVIYKVMTSEIADLHSRRGKEIIRKQELAVVKAQNLKYQQTLKDLETRIDVIQALQNSRVGPVEMMNTLGNVVNKTSDVYLYTLAPAGERFTLKGQSGTVNSMANFMAFLKNAGTFKDVQLNQFYEDDKNDHLTYKFTLSCQFKSPTGGISPTSGAAPEVPSGPAPAAGPEGPAGKPPSPGGTPAKSVPAQGPPQRSL